MVQIRLNFYCRQQQTSIGFSLTMAAPVTGGSVASTAPAPAVVVAPTVAIVPVNTPTKRGPDPDTPNKWFSTHCVKFAKLDIKDPRDAATRDLVCDTMVHLDEFPGDAQLLSSQLRKWRRDHEAQANARCDIGGIFEKVGSLRQTPIDFIIDWVLSVSDLTLADIKLAKSYDGDAPWHLVSYGTQLSMSWKLHAKFKNSDLFKRFLTERHIKVGSNLARVKANGKLQVSGKLDWKDSCLKLAFDKKEHKLISITHTKTGALAALPNGHNFSTFYKYTGFWCDEDASAVLAPMPAVRLATLFGKQPQVFGYTRGNNTKKSSDAFDVEVGILEAAWLADAEKVKAGANSKSSAIEVKKEMKQLQSERSKTTMTAARVKALASAQETSKKREMNFS
jgi:hypothetical protein